VTQAQDLARLPFPRDPQDVNGIAPKFRALRSQSPVVRVGTSAGDEAWLVTRYGEVKQLLNDPRLGRSHAHPERAARVANAAVLTGPLGKPEDEVPTRTRFRRLLSPAFSPPCRASEERCRGARGAAVRRARGGPEPGQLP